MNRKERVAGAFAAAAETYDHAAEAQAAAADRLVELVMDHSFPANPTVLEVGCGTGLLTRRLQPRLGGDWLVTDLSAAMVAMAERSINAPATSFRVMDAEVPDVPTALFDLVVSNMAAQWFSDLGRTVRRLLSCLGKGGMLAFSTLGQGSFAQWRAAHDALGFPCGTPRYPTVEDLARILPAEARIVRQTVDVRHADAFAFLDALRQVGADTPAAGHVPLSPGAMRRVIRKMGAPAVVTYDILHVVIMVE